MLNARHEIQFKKFLKQKLSKEPVKAEDKDSYIERLKKQWLGDANWKEPTTLKDSSDDELVLPPDYKTQKEVDRETRARSNFTSSKKHRERQSEVHF